jgi:hypothetical protein
VFTNNKISQTGANAILLERHYGASDVSHNTFDRGVADGPNDAYFSMNYGPDITTLQKVKDNKIDMGSGTTFDSDHRGFAITFAGAFAGADGGFTNVEVDHNEILNLKPFRRGISFWNNGAGAGGDITGVITDNGRRLDLDDRGPPARADQRHGHRAQRAEEARDRGPAQGVVQRDRERCDHLQQ